MTHEKILKIYASGKSPAQIATLFNMSIKEVEAIIGVTQADTINYSASDNLETKAIDALAKLLNDMENNPENYKPNEILAVAREILDRTRGKPTQSIDMRAMHAVTSIPPIKINGSLFDWGIGTPVLPHSAPAPEKITSTSNESAEK